MTIESVRDWTIPGLSVPVTAFVPSRYGNVSGLVGVKVNLSITENLSTGDSTNTGVRGKIISSKSSENKSNSSWAFRGTFTPLPFKNEKSFKGILSIKFQTVVSSSLMFSIRNPSPTPKSLAPPPVSVNEYLSVPNNATSCNCFLRFLILLS